MPNKLKFEFFKLLFFTFEKVRFGFLKKNSPHIFSLCFGYDSALKTKDAHMFFWSVFLKTQECKS